MFVREFPAKILLFGEYTVINGGSALAIPYDQYKGKWVPSEKTTLEGFFDYLLTMEGVYRNRVEQAKSEQWQFVSSIPMGYGLGSSGALSAAAFESFFKPVLTLAELKIKLATIESYFHGQSSGLDPLTCYTHQPIRIEAGHISQSKGLTLPPELHLYDSGQTRNGKPLIESFIKRASEDVAFSEVVTSLSRYNEDIINQLIARKDIKALFREISFTQFNHFKEMIPSSVASVWKKGLVEESYYMKLSGAGGGGYFLVWVCDVSKTYPNFEKIELKRSFHDRMHVFKNHFWLGKFESQEVYAKFMKETFSGESENDDVPISEFAKSQGHIFIDHDFMEYCFEPKSTTESFKAYKTITDNFFPDVDTSSYNVLIMCSVEEVTKPKSVSNESYTLDYIGRAEYTNDVIGDLSKK